jgi:large subunit ribosomal protein L32e
MAKKDVINDFNKIQGVGKAKAEALFKSGYDSIEKLKEAGIKDLTKVDGITDTIAKNIKNQFKKEQKEEKPKEPKKEKVEKTKTEKAVEKKQKPEKKAEKQEKKEEKPKDAKKDVEEEIKSEEKEEEYKVKKKPELSKDIKKNLNLRRRIKKRTPEFLREEWFRYKRLSKSWRRPDGISSKMRRNFKYRPSKVRVGFRGPKEVRGLHSSGFEEVVVHNVNDLEGIDPKKQAARIGSSVGTKKRIDIEKKADELEVRILNL